MVVSNNNQEFVFIKDGLKTFAPEGSSVYVVVQDIVKGKIAAHGKVIDSNNKEVGFFSVGEVEGLKMSDSDVLSSCHATVIAELQLLNPDITFNSVI